jgi:hypothetical protein
MGAVGSKAAAAAESGAASLRDSANAGLAAVQSLNQERLAAFCMLSSAAGLLLFLAFAFGLPVVALFPAKFALPFTLGSLCNLCALGALRGVRGQLNHMSAPERLPISTAYVGSMLLTLYVTFVLQSYVLCILASGVQLACLLYYTLSYFPGGAQGARLIFAAARRMVGPVMSAIATTCQACWSSQAERESLRGLLPI